MINHSDHISSHLAKMILKWKDSNPNAIRAIKKVNDEGGGFLFADSHTKQKAIEEYRLKNFELSNGQKLDLSQFKQACAKQKNGFF